MVRKHFYPPLKDGGNNIFFFKTLCHKIIIHNLEKKRTKESHLNDCLNKNISEILSKYGSSKFCVTEVNKSRFKLINFFSYPIYEVDIFQPFGMVSLIFKEEKCKEAYYFPYNNETLYETYKSLFEKIKQ